jgi:hypothetical protein
MVPVLIGLGIAAAVAGLIAVVIKFFLRDRIIEWDKIIEWFRSSQALKEADKDNIAFTLLPPLTKGRYSLVQGIFNTRTNELVAGVKHKGKEIDDKLREVHKTHALVIYE